MPNIRELLARRTDLSTFVVHLSRQFNGQSARANLDSILAANAIHARSAFGSAASVLKDPADRATQNCVCFTETPLEHLHLFYQQIEDLERSCEFAPYGVAITKRIARESGVNPVWYTDISPTGHTWLMNSVNALINDALAQTAKEKKANPKATFGGKPIAKLAPFIEQMGHQPKVYRKEFWWEREWRHVGDYTLPNRFIVIAPHSEHSQILEAANADDPHRASAIDATWGLEEIIGRLAGFSDDQVGVPV